MNISKFLIATSLCVATFSAMGQGQQMRDKAYQETNRVYRSGGMVGLTENSDKCHRTSKQPVYCIYLDIMANRLDAAMVDPIGMPRNPYFEARPIALRIDSAFNKAKIKQSQRPALFQRIVAEVDGM